MDIITIISTFRYVPTKDSTGKNFTNMSNIYIELDSIYSYNILNILSEITTS